VRDDVPDEHAFFSADRELGPVAAHGCVEAQQAALDEEEETDGHEPLRAGEHHDHRLLPPGRPGLVGAPAPDVDDELPFDYGGERRARTGNGRGQLVGDALEAVGDVAVDLGDGAAHARAAAASAVSMLGVSARSAFV
jgi:hypothetical protein